MIRIANLVSKKKRISHITTGKFISVFFKVKFLNAGHKGLLSRPEDDRNRAGIPHGRKVRRIQRLAIPPRMLPIKRIQSHPPKEELNRNDRPSKRSEIHPLHA
jgi:hypothetical protein